MPKLKTILSRKWAVPIACLIFGALAGYVSSCAISSRSAERAQAALLAQIADKDAANAKLEALNRQILAQHEAIKAENALIEAQRADLSAKLEQATATIEDLENAEPVQPELEREPLVINLRFQIAEHKNRYSLAMEDIAAANKIIANQKVQILGMEQAYTNALQMYINSDTLLNNAVRVNARLVKQNSTLKTVTKVEGALVVVLVILNLVK